MSNTLVCRLLIFTVGGSPDPIVASIRNFKPGKILFVPSPETSGQIESQILPLLEKEEYPLTHASYEVKPVPDAQDFDLCVKALRHLKPDVDAWTRRGNHFMVAADITGGTKCMSAALALVAHQWVCEFIYVGGTERSKGGIGVVVSGKEQVVNSANPWNSLGYQAAEEAILFFNGGNYLAAVESITRALPRIGNTLAKSELSALKQLAEAYERWDCFDHKGAGVKFADVYKNLNDLAHCTQMDRTFLEQTILKHKEIVDSLAQAIPSMETVLDLIANARRRAGQGRYEDAVARLYRAIEAIAQVRLSEEYKINTADVAAEKLPETIRSKWVARKKGQRLMLPLQGDYELLRDLQDPLSTRFDSLGFDSKESSLGMRNNSILAHGFAPVGEVGFDGLLKKTLGLCSIEEQTLPEFLQFGQQ